MSDHAWVRLLHPWTPPAVLEQIGRMIGVSAPCHWSALAAVLQRAAPMDTAVAQLCVADACMKTSPGAWAAVWPAAASAVRALVQHAQGLQAAFAKQLLVHWVGMGLLPVRLAVAAGVPPACPPPRPVGVHGAPPSGPSVFARRHMERCKQATVAMVASDGWSSLAARTHTGNTDEDNYMPLALPRHATGTGASATTATTVCAVCGDALLRVFDDTCLQWTWTEAVTRVSGCMALAHTSCVGTQL